MHKMKVNAKKIVTAYFGSWWIPSITAFLSLIAFMVMSLPNLKHLTVLANGLLLFLGLSLLGILAAAVWNLVKKHWGKGIVNLLMFPLLLIACLIGSGFLMFASMFGTSDDGFADQLIIPDNIEISQPLDWDEESQGRPGDTFQSSLLAALATPGNEDASITAELPSLVLLSKNAPDILMRYLATSPSWRVFREKGARFATRRWMIGTHWRYVLHGYYAHITFIIAGQMQALPRFQSRLTLGFSGKPWSRASRKSTLMQQGQTMRLNLSIGNKVNESHCVITADELIVEVFEQSEAIERRLTKATLVHLEEELRPLAMDPEWSTIQSMLPPGTIRRGEPTIELRESFQPGIYDSEIWVNPGESGMIYLKAYEVTQDYRLSAERLKERSNEWVGWSDDPSQLFLSNTHFKIYEGDWGKPYAARFEVWFVPDSGEGERKLIEKIFRIEGWQR